MTATDPYADNVFARLFTYSPRSEEHSELENYCTEALAWCLITSKQFASAFLHSVQQKLGPHVRPKLMQFHGALDIATQVPSKRDAEAENPNEARARFFDLCLRSSGTFDFFIVIEVKVEPDNNLAQQIDTYIRTLKEPQWARFHERYILTLTPGTSENTKADGHLNWQQIEDQLGRLTDSNLMLHKRFADFLRREHITYVKLPELSSEVIQHLRAAGPFLANARDLFRGPTFKKSFRPLVAERPVIGFGDGALWYGIYGNTPDGWRYAAFYIGEKKIAIYAEFIFTGDRSHFAERFDGELDGAREEAKSLKQVKEFDGEKTTFAFAREVPRSIDSEAVLTWFGNVFSKIEKIATEKP
jgi:hypothetical protein